LSSTDSSTDSDGVTRDRQVESRIDGDSESWTQPGVVLVADDLPGHRTLLTRHLVRDGHEVIAAANGSEALTLAAERDPDVVLADVMMPGVDGLQLCRSLKSTRRGWFTPVVLVTSLHGRTDRIKGIEAGADDFIVKPFDGEEVRARVRSLVRLKRSMADLDSAEAVIMSLAMTVEARDLSTQGHCDRIADGAVRLGTRLGLGGAAISALRRGGVLHDIGKIAIPDAILLKPGPLTPGEVEQMRRHTVIGDQLCQGLRLLQPVRPIVRSHHERLDGSGYPDGLKGSRVPLLAQIVAIVDVYDALTTARPYKQALSTASAFEQLHLEAKRGWHDAALIAEFMSMHAAAL
jgi:putative two-component system response regulator